jgi:hypothetical protein
VCMIVAAWGSYFYTFAMRERAMVPTHCSAHALVGLRNMHCALAETSLPPAAVDACVACRPIRPQDPVQRLRSALHEDREAQVGASPNASLVNGPIDFDNKLWSAWEEKTKKCATATQPEWLVVACQRATMPDF